MVGTYCVIFPQHCTNYTMAGEFMKILILTSIGIGMGHGVL